MDNGNFEDALNLVREVQAIESSRFVFQLVGGFLIDIGTALNEEELVKKRNHLIRKIFRNND